MRPDSGPGAETGAAQSRSRRPVLLLHGFLSTGRSLGVLRHRLIRDGYLVVSPDLGPAAPSGPLDIDGLAALVHARVEALYRRHPDLGPLAVVGHSRGGLVAVDWVKRFGGSRRVRTVVTLATPHRGTPVAWAGLPLAPFVPSLLQMAPRSAFLRRLAESPWPARVGMVSLYSRRDALVPFPAAVLDTRGRSDVRNVEVEGGHRDFLVKKRIYAQVLREIRSVEAAGLRPVRPGRSAA